MIKYGFGYPLRRHSPPAHAEGEIIRYSDLLDEADNLKSKQDLQLQNVYLDWWSRVQIELRYTKDRLCGFYKE